MEWKEAVCRMSLWELGNRGHLTDCTPPRTRAEVGWGAGSPQTADVDFLKDVNPPVIFEGSGDLVLVLTLVQSCS